jgi:hypothetical protein
MKKRISKQEKLAENLINERIQRAINRLQIPMMQISKLAEHARAMIAQGATDEQLRDGVVQFLNA